ncbi:acyltransferase family protein [Pseudoalteromonas ostreae]|uniref:acyltransferase family protein n=1 Tax=Pseudoalteromonas ostreae TaxID=2774154 RepID=UPI001B3632FD|nr:acyltransferase [Pseudoalteromonas ostreae]
MFYNSINNFRAIAIIFIVFGHSFDVSGVVLDSFWEVFIRNFLSGGTILFVFISGFLFEVVFLKKFNFSKFYISRVSRLIWPYIFLSLLPIFLYMYVSNPISEGYFLPKAEDAISKFIVPFLKYEVTGRFMTAYWYIPFALFLFLLSPLVVFVLKKNLKFKVIVILALSCLSIFAHRPVDNINHIHSVVFFFPVYLIGALASQYRESLIDLFQGNKLWLFFLLSIMFTLIQTYSGSVGSYHKAFFELTGIDYMYLQKVFLSFFFFLLLEKHSKETLFFNYLAETSFAVFFIHPYLIFIYRNLKFPFPETTLFQWLYFIALSLTFILISMLLALLVKKLLDDRSKYIIGY